MIIIYGSRIQTRPAGQARIYRMPHCQRPPHLDRRFLFGLHSARKCGEFLGKTLFSFVFGHQLHLVEKFSEWCRATFGKEVQQKYQIPLATRSVKPAQKKFIQPATSFQFWPSSGQDARSVCKQTIPIRSNKRFGRGRMTKLMGSGI